MGFFFFLHLLPFCELWYHFLPFLYLKASVFCKMPLWPREVSNTGTWGRHDSSHPLLLPGMHHSTRASAPPSPPRLPAELPFTALSLELPLRLAPVGNDPKNCPVPTPCTDMQRELGQSNTQHGPTDQKSSGSEVCRQRSTQSNQETLMLRLRGDSTSYTSEIPSWEIDRV